MIKATVIYSLLCISLLWSCVNNCNQKNDCDKHEYTYNELRKLIYYSQIDSLSNLYGVTKFELTLDNYMSNNHPIYSHKNILFYPTMNQQYKNDSSVLYSPYYICIYYCNDTIFKVNTVNELSVSNKENYNKNTLLLLYDKYKKNN